MAAAVTDAADPKRFLNTRRCFSPFFNSSATFIIRWSLINASSSKLTEKDVSPGTASVITAILSDELMKRSKYAKPEMGISGGVYFGGKGKKDLSAGVKWSRFTVVTKVMGTG